MPLQQQDLQKLMNTPVSLPMRAALGIMPSSYWARTADLSRASADSLGHQVGTFIVESVENEKIPEL